MPSFLPPSFPEQPDVKPHTASSGMTRGVPLCFIALRKNAFAAATSRRSLSRKIHRSTLLVDCPIQVRPAAIHLYIGFVTRHDPPTARAYRVQHFSNSGTYRCTHLRIVVCASWMPRSPIISTRSRELSVIAQIPPDTQDDDLLVKMPYVKQVRVSCLHSTPLCQCSGMCRLCARTVRSTYRTA